MNKVMTAWEAVSRYIQDGDCLALGGFSTNRRGYGLVREIIRQRRHNLCLESGAAGGDFDMLVGAGCASVLNISYAANSGFSMVCRRFRDAVEQGRVLFEDYSLDVQTIAYHGAALGLPYVPVKNMLGSDLQNKWGIPREVRTQHPKLADYKFLLGENPFQPGETLCLVPTPEIDVAILHVQCAGHDGTCRILGPHFLDVDLALAAKHTIISCEELVSEEELRRHPEQNTLPSICVDAVVPMRYGAHPSQCFGCYDYDAQALWEYEELSKTQEDFDAFLEREVFSLASHEDYLALIGADRLKNLSIDSECGYRRGMDRGPIVAVK